MRDRPGSRRSPEGRSELASPARWWWQALLALGVAAAAYTITGVFYGSVPGDDAFITFRYADNWLRGHGPVWNPGERVEGYSNPLFLVLLTALGGVGIPIPSAADLLSVLGLALILALVVRWARELLAAKDAQWGAAAVAAGLVLVHPSVALYLHEGLESVLHAALLLLALFLVRGEAISSRRTAAVALVAALLALSRPEGIALTAAIGMLCVSVPGSRWRRAAIFAAIAGGVVIAWLALRFWFYGELVPNTAYVKLAEPLLRRFVRGAEYVVRGGAVLLFLPLAASPLWPLEALRQRRSLLCLTVGVLAVVSFPVLAGGDWMRGYRFLLPALPLAALLWGVAAAALWQRALEPWRGLRVATGALALIALLAWFALGHLELVRIHREDAEWISAHEALGVWLRENTPPETLVALGAVGAVSYRSGRRVLDCWGLNDAWIARSGKRARGVTTAHQAYDGEYVWRRRPDWVFPFNGPLDDALDQPLDEASFRELVLTPPQLSRFWAAELMAQPGFAGTYRYRAIEVAPGIWFGAYQRSGEDPTAGGV